MGGDPVVTYKYEFVPNIFLQSDYGTDSDAFEYSKQDFGLIPRAYPTDSLTDSAVPQWQRLITHLRHLSHADSSGVTYKLIYAGRHGEGYHNVAEAFYGTKAWDEYWSKLDGNETSFWSDSHLTEIGQQQARDASSFFRHQFTIGMPAAQRYYVSPLYRCLQTADLTFARLDLPPGRAFEPTIKEMMREALGEHTCDRRSSRSIIHAAFPSWTIEAEFAEDDELWRADHRESHDEHDIRTTRFLDDLFMHDESLVVSLTSHSGAIASLLRVVGHREFRLPTGAMIAVVVKATPTTLETSSPHA